MKITEKLFDKETLLNIVRDWKRDLPIAACVLFLLVFGVYKLVNSGERYVVISLLYQEASEGLNPNGSRYDPYYITSEEFLSQFVDKYGDDLYDNISVRTSSHNRGEGISTEYKVSCEAFVNCDEILTDISHTYADQFAAKYTTYDTILDYHAPENDLDYIETADYLEKEAAKINTFISKQIKKDTSWRGTDGMNYNDLLEYGKNIVDIDILNLRTFITENGLTKDAGALISKVEYRDRLLESDRSKAQAQYGNRKEAIELYDPTLFPTISVPSVSQGQYFITTTKTGLDYIFDAANFFSEDAYNFDKMLSKDALLIANMTEDRTSEEAEQMIKDIEQKMDVLIENARTLSAAYAEQKYPTLIKVSEVMR